ncbi:hypothetical protein ACFL6S_04910 [Candidatus Poribacteria bacterium]
MDGQLTYSFISLATARNTPDGITVPVEGMKLLAALAHRYGIPVTWVVDSNSVQESKAVLTQGHKECGDDVILQIDVSSVFEESGSVPESKAEEIVILRQRLPELIISQREKVKEMLPWADVNIISVDLRSEALIEILEELDCIGLWGYRWRETGEDAGESGFPWGFFYASEEHHDAPAQSAGGLVAVESSSLDLNSVFHTGNSHIFSADPNTLRASGLHLDEGLNYPRALLDEYLKNCSWNRFSSFVQQQPAYEMEYANYDEYDSGTIREIADMLEGFFQAAKSNAAIQALSLSQAIQLYRREFAYTESCYMVFDGIVPPHVEINYYVPPEPKQKPPYPFAFFYYDRECQLIFREGEMIPVEMRNYFRPPFESKHYLEKEMPSISHFRPSRDRDKLILEFEIESVKKMPYGLAIWDDHSMFSLVSTNARLVKWIGDHLLFIRMDLEEGLNRVEVSLVI